MKIFSSLIAFMIIFSCLSTAYADVAFPPSNKVKSQFVTISADTDGISKLRLKFNFPVECLYKYQLIDKKTEKEIHSGEGSCKKDDIVEEIIELQDWLSAGENNFALNIQMDNIAEQTPFGTKIRKESIRLERMILITTIRGMIYDCHFYE